MVGTVHQLRGQLIDYLGRGLCLLPEKGNFLLQEPVGLQHMIVELSLRANWEGVVSIGKRLAECRIAL